MTPQVLINERLRRVVTIDGKNWNMGDCVVVETDRAVYRVGFDEWVLLSEPIKPVRSEDVPKWALDQPILRALTDGSNLVLMFEGGVMWVLTQFNPDLVAPSPTTLDRVKGWLGMGPRQNHEPTGFYAEFEERAKFDEWYDPATMFDTRVITDL